MIIYHKADLDGYFSGALVKSIYKDETLYGIDYNETIDDSVLDAEGIIYIVDFSLPVHQMQKYAGKMVWIDHHRTAIEDSKKYGYDDILGVRDENYAACELVYAYLYKQSSVFPLEEPAIIKYVGNWDIHRRTGYDEWHDTEVVQLGLKYKYFDLCNGIEPLVRDLNLLLGWSKDDIKNDLIYSNGNLLWWHQQAQNKSLVKSAFEVQIDGKPALAIVGPIGSAVFDSVKNREQLWVVFNGISPKGAKMSVYKDPDVFVDFNCGDYLKEHYGGGGHPSAAGAFIDFDTFTDIIKSKTV